MGQPTWMYRRGAFGRVEARVFDSEEIPAGWVDSPAKLETAPKPAKPKKPRTRLRSASYGGRARRSPGEGGK